MCWDPAPPDAAPRPPARAQSYAEQGDLFGVVRRSADGALPDAFAAQIMLQLTCAVAACHEHGIIHRDIKPENVVMDSDGLCRLTDFGLAIDTREERPASRVGTLDYLVRPPQPPRTRGDRAAAAQPPRPPRRRPAGARDPAHVGHAQRAPRRSIGSPCRYYRRGRRR